MKTKGIATSRAIMYSLSWFPVAVYALYLKRIYVDAKYFSLLYSVSNIGQRPRHIDRLFIYKDDVFLGFVVVPLLVILTTRLGREKTQRISASGWLVASLGALALLFANMHSWGTVGRFLSYTAAVDAITFGLQNRSFITMYIDVGSWTKISTIAASVVLGFSLAGRLSRTQPFASAARHGVVFVLVLAGAFSVAGSLSAMKTAPIARSFLVSSIAALTDTGARPALGDVPPPNELARAFRELTRTTRSAGAGPFTGAAKGDDLIVLVIETGSSRFVDVRNDLGSFPALQKLSRNSLIAFKHYATFPASSESLSSFFFGLYPPRSYYSTCVVSLNPEPTRRFPGFVSSLKEAGYHTAAYLPFRDVLPVDVLLRARAGFDTVYFAQNEEPLDGRDHDEMALDTMKEDVSRWLRSGQRYAAVFLPQAGHPPWPTRPKSRSIPEHGKMVAVRHDEWLGEIVDILERYGRLDNTTILFTADHGVRTTGEDPEFRSGFIDEYSFAVPLLIYSKGAFTQPVYVDVPTSHIDVSPSLQELFGLVHDTSPEQGLNLWDNAIRKRTLFFLGNWYLGADGFHDDGRFAMYSEVLDVSFSSNRLSFDFGMLSRKPEEASEIKRRVAELYALQEGWVQAFLCR